MKTKSVDNEAYRQECQENICAPFLTDIDSINGRETNYGPANSNDEIPAWCLADGEYGELVRKRKD
jgi:hypothetical protein